MALGVNKNVKLTYTNANQSYLQSTAAFLSIANNFVSIQRSDTNCTMAHFRAGAENSFTWNYVKRLSTSSIGATVFGQLDTTDINASGIGTFSGVDVTGGTLERSSTGNKLMFVGSCETRLTHSSGSKVLFDFHGSSGFLGRIDAHAGAIVLNNGGNKTSAVFRNQGSVELYYDNAGTSTKRFQTSNTGAKVIGILTATSITSPKYDGDADRNIIMGWYCNY